MAPGRKVIRESHWEYTAMWLETSSVTRLNTVQHASLGSGRIRSIVVKCVLLSKTLRNTVKTTCFFGRGGGDRIYQAAESKGTLRNVL